MEALKEALSEGTKPWGEMFERLQVPLNLPADEIQSRIEGNLLYYACNYLLIMLGIFTYSLFSHPPLILFALLAAVLLVAIHTREIYSSVNFLTTLNPFQRTALVFLLLFGLLSFYKLLTPFLWPFLTSATLIIVHSAIRPANMKSKLNHLKTKAETSDLGQQFKSLQKDIKKEVKKAFE